MIIYRSRIIIRSTFEGIESFGNQTLTSDDLSHHPQLIYSSPFKSQPLTLLLKSFSSIKSRLDYQSK